jgi:hypothetical protein
MFTIIERIVDMTDRVGAPNETTISCLRDIASVGWLQESNPENKPIEVMGKGLIYIDGKCVATYTSEIPHD